MAEEHGAGDREETSPEHKKKPFLELLEDLMPEWLTSQLSECMRLMRLEAHEAKRKRLNPFFTARIGGVCTKDDVSDLHGHQGLPLASVFDGWRQDGWTEV